MRRFGSFVVGWVVLACGSTPYWASPRARKDDGPSEAAVEPRPNQVPPEERSQPPWFDAVTAHVNETRASVMLPVEISRGGYRIFGFSAPDLAPVFAHARAVRDERHEVAGAALVFDFQRIRYGNWVIYDGQPEFLRLAAEELEHRKGGEEGHRNALSAFGLRPLSLVGSLLTYERTWACACAGGPPSSEVSWTTVDLSARRAPSLLDFFEEESLVSALLDDRCVAPLFPSSDLRPTSLDQVLSALEEQSPPLEDCSGASRAFSEFALAGYHSDQDLVRLRLGFRHEIGPGHSKTSYLGLLVQPRPSFHPALLEAIRGKGFFMTEEE